MKVLGSEWQRLRDRSKTSKNKKVTGVDRLHQLAGNTQVKEEDREAPHSPGAPVMTETQTRSWSLSSEAGMRGVDKT